MSNSDASGPRSRAPHGAAGASPPSASIAIAELRDLLSRATAGEWAAQVGKNGAFTVEGYAPGLRVVCSRMPWEHRADESAANGHLIAAAKNSMAALLDAYEERERLARATASCEGEQEHFEKWAKDHGLDMHEHPLHYLFLDPRTSAARAAWKAALEYVRRAALEEPSNA